MICPPIKFLSPQELICVPRGGEVWWPTGDSHEKKDADDVAHEAQLYIYIISLTVSNWSLELLRLSYYWVFGNLGPENIIDGLKKMRDETLGSAPHALAVGFPLTWCCPCSLRTNPSFGGCIRRPLLLGKDMQLHQ